METFFYFERLVEKYERPTTYTVETEGYRDPATGRWVNGVPDTSVRMVAVLPVDSQTIYQSGGRITSAERLLYTRYPLDVRGHIQYEGARWTIERFGDFTEYGDFYRYLARREATA